MSLEQSFSNMEIGNIEIIIGRNLLQTLQWAYLRGASDVRFILPTMTGNSILNITMMDIKHTELSDSNKDFGDISPIRKAEENRAPRLKHIEIPDS